MSIYNDPFVETPRIHFYFKKGYEERTKIDGKMMTQTNLFNGYLINIRSKWRERYENLINFFSFRICLFFVLYTHYQKIVKF